MSAVRRLNHESYATIFSVVYLGLVTNALLAVALLPLFAVLAVTDTAQSWPLLVALVPALVAPALAAAFTVFSAYSNDSTIGVIRTFGRAWRATYRRAFALAAAVSGAVVVLVVDVVWARGTAFGGIAVPVLGVLALLAVATGLLGLAAVAEAPTARLRDVLKVSLYFGVRRWYLTAVSFFSIGLLVAAFVAKPALALGLAAAPLLYVAWANSRFSLRPVLPVREIPAGA